MEQICKLKDIYKALYNFEKLFQDKNGITINEGMVLCCLKDNKPRSANELCDFIGLSHSRVSRVINTIEAKGLIIREMGSTDKRQMIFTLSDSGKKKVKEMMKQDMNFSELGTYLLKLVE